MDPEGQTCCCKNFRSTFKTGSTGSKVGCWSDPNEDEDVLLVSWFLEAATTAVLSLFWKDADGGVSLGGGDCVSCFLRSSTEYHRTVEALPSKPAI